VEKGIDGKRRLPFVCCKQKTETANFHLFVANGKGKRKFVFLGQQTIKDNQTIAVSANMSIYALRIL
jgi:hypothetical protein